MYGGKVGCRNIPALYVLCLRMGGMVIWDVGTERVELDLMG